MKRNPTRQRAGLIGGLLRRPYLVCALLAALALPAAAVSTATFTASTFEELNRGEPQGTLISSEGEVVAGRDLTRLKLKTPVAMVWSRVRAPDGTVYFGGGDRGRVLAVKGGKARTVARTDAVLISALDLAGGGKLVAGTLTGGRVLIVDPKTGKYKTHCRLPAEHIWDIKYDARTRRFFAATGTPGKVFVINERDAAFGVYWDSGEKHLLSLVKAPSNDLWVGSADKAVLYHITNIHKAKALHDFEASELTRVVAAPGGGFFVAVNSFAEKTSGLPRRDKSAAGEGGTPIKTPKKKKGAIKPKVRASELRPGAKEGKGAVYRVSKQGHAEQLLVLSKGYFTDLQLDAQGILWAAEGTKGRVYMIKSDRTVLTAFDLPERQVLALAVNSKTEQYLGTGDAGALYRVRPGSAKTPRFLSEVFDAKVPALWGNLTYQASGKLRLESRSGNTAKPDKTWNDWTQARKSTGDSARVTSPPARYLQLRMTWPRPYSGKLRSFTAYYRPQNRRARVTALTFARDAGDKAKDKPRTAKIKLTWKVDNPDGDALVYRVYVRPELGVKWQRISGPDPLTKAELDWDTEPVPDGHYRVKVVATDEQANGPLTALTDERISARVLVDNVKPKVTGLTVRYPYGSGLARDTSSAVRRMEYSLDGKDWRLLDPMDGIYDSPSEFFRFRLPAVGKGHHMLAVRAVDEAGNMGVSQVRFSR